MSLSKKQLFLKYLRNQCSEEELVQVFAHLESSGFPEEFVEIMDEDALRQLASQQKLPPGTSEEMLKGTWAEIYKKVPVQKSQPTLRFPVLRMAAAITGILCIAAAAYFLYFNSTDTFYATGFGETQQIVLPDSSVVILNANSRLTLSPAWEDWQHTKKTETLREVWLEGEAFFEVYHLAHPAPSKFIVHTNNLQVEVLGTKFNVNTRRNKTQVVLNTGKVKVTDPQKEAMIMQPGDLVAYSVSDKKFHKKIVDPAQLTAWKEGRFAFDSTPIKSIAQMLEDTYGYSVNIEGEILANRKFTANIPSHNVETLLVLIAESLDVEIERTENEINIKN